MTTTAVDLRPYRRRLHDARMNHGRRSSQALRAFEDLFRVAARSGQPLDALRRYSKHEPERFFAQTIPGPDGHVFWDGGRGFRRNDGKTRSPLRWWWAHSHGVEPGPYEDVVPMCGNGSCINPEHAVMDRSARRRRFTDQQIIGTIQVAALRLGHAPTQKEWLEGGYSPTDAIVVQRFGSWGDALRTAGYQHDTHFKIRVDEDACLTTLRFLRDELGRTPEATDLRRLREQVRAQGLPSSPTTIRRYLGEWPNALKKAGIAA
jgi:hypothetical protein